tara:strand:+ start:2520 stop:3683 length:1164 start_codon:yes stop_codon:yes gene_type:complete
MKKKIAILGSTGSIGKSLLNIVSKDVINFDIILLTAKKNYKKLLIQAKKFNVKNIIITDKMYFLKAKEKNNNNRINIYNNFTELNKIFKKKIDYTMSSIMGIDGLYPTIEMIKHTKKIAIANKEPIICAWNLIKKELRKNKTEFIPVDSEHFSIWYALKNTDISKVEKIYLTASGGPLLNSSIKNFDKLKLSQILNHPNWKMGKKISIDSSTMMNKVFEIIEAKKIFDISYNKLSILIHPKSYIHAILKLTDGMIKIIAHDTTMEIPIFNTIYNKKNNKIKTKNLSLDKLNNLNLTLADYKRFPLLKILNKLPKKNSLYETVIVAGNDELVNLYLQKKIKFTDIHKKLFKLLKTNDFNKYKRIVPKNVSEINKLNQYVRFKVNSKSI